MFCVLKPTADFLDKVVLLVLANSPLFPLTARLKNQEVN